MGERPSTWRNRSSSNDRDTFEEAASSATVHLRSGSRCRCDSAGARTGSRKAESHPRSGGGRGGDVQSKHLGQHDRRQRRQHLRVGAPFGGLEHVPQTRLHPGSRRAGRPDHEDRRQRGECRIEQRIVDVEIPADHIGPRATGAMSDDRELASTAAVTSAPSPTRTTCRRRHPSCAGARTAARPRRLDPPSAARRRRSTPSTDPRR